MSEANGKVCCNCRHNIRTGEKINIQCHCDIDGSWLSYVTVMTHGADIGAEIRSKKMGMSIKEAIKKNPYDPNKGNKSAYCRYLRYNVKGWYNLDSKEVLRKWQSEVKDGNVD